MTFYEYTYLLPALLWNVKIAAYDDRVKSRLFLELVSGNKHHNVGNASPYWVREREESGVFSRG